MDFSHFPRLENDLVVGIHWPRPPEQKPFKSLPAFAPRNPILAPLEPGASILCYHSAANFTRFLASVASDQPLRIEALFSMDEVAPDGTYVSDSNIALLNWDVTTFSKTYKPGEAHAGLFFVRAGKWLKLVVINIGEAPAEVLRFYVRGTPL